VWNLVLGGYSEGREVSPAVRQKAERDLSRVTHQTIRRVSGDLERLRLNTMIAALMEFTNYLAKAKEIGSVTEPAWKGAVDTLLLLLAPTAPHLAEELWQRMGHNYSIHNQTWPKWDEALAREEEITLVVQVNGKLRDRITVPASITKDEAIECIKTRRRVRVYLEPGQTTNIIFVPGRLVNFVVKQE